MRRNIRELTPSFMFKFNKKIANHSAIPVVLAYLNCSIKLTLRGAVVCGNDEINQTAVELFTTLQPI